MLLTIGSAFSVYAANDVIESNTNEIIIEDENEHFLRNISSDMALSDELDLNIAINNIDTSIASVNSVETINSSDHNTANTAFYIDSSYFDYVISDEADENDNWYYFNNPSQSKITVQVGNPSGAAYDIYLYKFNEGSLSLASYSLYDGGTLLNLSCIAEADYYFLRLNPFIAPTESSTLNFAIDITTTYDSNEPDDSFLFATEYSNSINVHKTIDNPFDIDTYAITVNTSGNYKVFLGNIPSDAKYALYIYNSDLSYYNGWWATNTSTIEKDITLSQGTHYIKIMSYNTKYSKTQNYNLIVSPVASGKVMRISPKGNIILIDSQNIYVDGIAIDLGWEYDFTSPGSSEEGYFLENQSTTPLSNPGIKIATNSSVLGSFRGNFVSAENAMQIQMTNFLYYYYYYYYKNNTTPVNRTSYTYYKEDDPGYAIFWIDLDNKKVADTAINIYYANGATYTFTQN